MTTNKFVQVAVGGAVTAAMFLSAVSGVSATAFNGELHLDNFNTLYLKPDERAEWWINNFLGGARYEEFCNPGNESCVSLVTNENPGDHFARFNLPPSVAASNMFVEAAMSELRTYGVTGAPGIWFPTVGHSITFETVARWSAGYTANASGDAVGTTGIVMWNSPYEPGDTGNGLFREAFFGFNWTGKGTLGGFLEGLKVNVVYNGFPIITDTPSFSINMNDWATYTAVWSVDANGVQSVEFSVNGQVVSQHVLPVALTPLSVQIWSDNQDVQFGPFGLSIGYKSPVTVQNMDINSVLVKQN